MTMQVDRDKLRAACRRNLEPLLNEFWENYRRRSGHDGRDSFGRHMSVLIARDSLQMDVDEAREAVNREPEPERSRASAVLDMYEGLVHEFFERQLRLTEQ